MANDYNSVLATCQRFQDIATWDPEHFNANGALARIAELHKHELAAKDAEIARLKSCLAGDCERTRLGAEPCEGCHIEHINERNEIIKSLADATEKLVCPLQGDTCAYCREMHGEKCSHLDCRALVAKAMEVAK